MTTEPPLSDLVARAHWHLGLGYFDDQDEEIDDRCFEDFHEPATCWNCGGEGFVITCCDDLCRGAGYCFHGDGHAMCHTCKGEGSL